MALLTKTPMLRLIALPVAKTIMTRAVGDGRVRICETCSLEIAALIAEQRAIGSGRSTDRAKMKNLEALQSGGGGGGLGEMT